MRPEKHIQRSLIQGKKIVYTNFNSTKLFKIAFDKRNVFMSIVKKFTFEKMYIFVIHVVIKF